jgi:hypothetical protein
MSGADFRFREIQGTAEVSIVHEQSLLYYKYLLSDRYEFQIDNLEYLSNSIVHYQSPMFWSLLVGPLLWEIGQYSTVLQAHGHILENSALRVWRPWAERSQLGRHDEEDTRYSSLHQHPKSKNGRQRVSVNIAKFWFDQLLKHFDPSGRVTEISSQMLVTAHFIAWQWLYRVCTYT